MWVRISGVPHGMLGDYLNLCCIGSLVGEIKEVDMAYTRKHRVIIILLKVI